MKGAEIVAKLQTLGLSKEATALTRERLGWMKELASLRAQNADLLTALEKAWDCLTTESPFASGSPLDGEIRAAIAKAKGKA